MKRRVVRFFVCIACIAALAGTASAGDDLRLDCKMKSGRIDAKMRSLRIGRAEVVEEDKVQNLAITETRKSVSQASSPTKSTRDINRKKRLTINGED